MSKDTSSEHEQDTQYKKQKLMRFNGEVVTLIWGGFWSHRLRCREVETFRGQKGTPNSKLKRLLPKRDFRDTYVGKLHEDR